MNIDHNAIEPVLHTRPVLKRRIRVCPLIVLLLLTVVFPHANATGPEDGIPTSLFGTYIKKGEFLVYPFFEYTRTNNYEYKPSELGFPGDQDVLGKLMETEYLLFLGYGITDRLAIEFEAAVHSTVKFERAPLDMSGVPDRIDESGVGDVETNIRWLWTLPDPARPTWYSFLKAVYPTQKDKNFLGTQDWEGELGFGFVKTFSWGALNGRVSFAYDGGDANKFEFGEYGLEAIFQSSPNLRLVTALEGESDELSAIGEIQYAFAKNATLKLNLGVGLTQKTADFAPEIGILFRF